MSTNILGKRKHVEWTKSEVLEEWTFTELSDFVEAVQYFGLNDTKNIAMAVGTKDESAVKIFIKKKIAKMIHLKKYKKKIPSRLVRHFHSNVKKWKKKIRNEMSHSLRLSDFSTLLMTQIWEQFRDEQAPPKNDEIVNVQSIYAYIAHCMNGINSAFHLPVKESAVLEFMMKTLSDMMVEFGFKEELYYIRNFKKHAIFIPSDVNDYHKVKDSKDSPVEIPDYNPVKFLKSFLPRNSKRCNEISNSTSYIDQISAAFQAQKTDKYSKIRKRRINDLLFSSSIIDLPATALQAKNVNMDPVDLPFEMQFSKAPFKKILNSTSHIDPPATALQAKNVKIGSKESSVKIPVSRIPLNEISNSTSAFIIDLPATPLHAKNNNNGSKESPVKIPVSRVPLNEILNSTSALVIDLPATPLQAKNDNIGSKDSPVEIPVSRVPLNEISNSTSALVIDLPATPLQAKNDNIDKVLNEIPEGTFRIPEKLFSHLNRCKNMEMFLNPISIHRRLLLKESSLLHQTMDDTKPSTSGGSRK